jgi:DNA-binding transcriptional regulator YiaG
MKNTGPSILKSLHEALKHRQGKKTRAREHTFSATDVARIRKSVGLSQQQFSDEFEMGSFGETEYKVR